MSAVAPTGATPLSFWAVFPVRANPLRKIFRGYTPPHPNFCRYVVPLNCYVDLIDWTDAIVSEPSFTASVTSNNIKKMIKSNTFSGIKIPRQELRCHALTPSLNNMKFGNSAEVKWGAIPVTSAW